MHFLIDDVDGSWYADIILSPKEMTEISRGEMICNCHCIGGKRIYLGIRLRGLWEKDDEEERNIHEEEDWF
jgi:hypothetical protein